MSAVPVAGYLNADDHQAAGLGFPVPAPPPPPDGVQHSVSYGLDYATGELVAYGPDGQVQR